MSELKTEDYAKLWMPLVSALLSEIVKLIFSGKDKKAVEVKKFITESTPYPGTEPIDQDFLRTRAVGGFRW